MLMRVLVRLPNHVTFDRTKLFPVVALKIEVNTPYAVPENKRDTSKVQPHRQRDWVTTTFRTKLRKLS